MQLLNLAINVLNDEIYSVRKAMHFFENLTVTAANAKIVSQLTEVGNDLVIELPVDLCKLTKVGGNLTVNSKGKLHAPALLEVCGSLIVYGVAHVPSVRTVGSQLYVYSGGILESSELAQIGKGLYVYPQTVISAKKISRVGAGVSINSDADFPNLIHVAGGLVINAKTALGQLSRVDDYVYIFANANVASLASIGGDLVVHPGATCVAQSLTSVGKRLVLYAAAELELLLFVGGDLHICASNKLRSLSHVNGAVCIDPNAVFLAPNLIESSVPETTIAEPADQGVMNPWASKQWTALGTSITIFGAYTQPLNSMLGTDLTNLSVGGGSLSSSSTSDPAGIYNQIVNIPQSADLVTFEAGMVDFRANAALGSLYDTGLDTFYGAIYRCIAETLAANLRRTVVFLTPYGIDSDEFKGRWNSPNENGNTLAQFVQAIKEVCDWCGVAYINVGQGAGIGGLTSAIYLADGVHLNPLGGQKMAEYIYDRLIFLRPCPTLGGSHEAGTDSWSLAPASTCDFSGTGLQVNASAIDQHLRINFALIDGYYFSSLWLSRIDCNAVEFVSLPTANNSLWIALGSGEAGWIAVGDFGNLGAQRIAIFDAGHGSVSFGSLITAKHSYDANSNGMKWRVRRNGTVVQIYHYRSVDCMWVEVGDPIDLSRQGFSPAYYQDIKIGILGTMGTVSHVFLGTCGPL